MASDDEAEMVRHWQRRSPHDASFWALLVVGLLLVVLPFARPLSRVLERALDPVHLVQLVLGFALVYIAFLLRDVRVLRQRNLVLMETVLAALRQGKLAQRDHEAVEILLVAVAKGTEQSRRAAVAQLERMTGQSFGEDAAGWQRWWEAHRDGFRARVVRSTREEASDEGGSLEAEQP